MVEFSKILKKIKPEAERPEPDIEQKSHVDLSGKARQQEGFGQQAKKPAISPRPSMERATPGAEIDASRIYEKMFALSKVLFFPGVDYNKVDTSLIVAAVAEAAGAVATGDERLTELALTYIIENEQYYLLQHSVNVCVISLQIGVGAGYEMGRLIELGIAAFLHDIGMTQFQNMANLSRRLTHEEYAEIKKHVEVGDSLLKKIHGSLGDTVLAAQNEIHERLDGSGYPAGKRNINEYARIIAIADAFESMIHPRPFRQRYSIMDVYKRIFGQKDKYDQAFIKILVDRVGFFPNGSFVQLNTKEVAKVVRQNPKSPLRPVVRVQVAEDGRQLYEDEIKEIDLSKYPTIHAKKCFLEETQK
ncbi:MAG TPA: hypothetical protein DCL35_05450 [Candidatus Omnitrophica bacterium]|nr:hypothetical protein [Candidatus Omnitrophota bacterium]